MDFLQEPLSVVKAEKVRIEEGILAKPEPKRGRGITTDELQEIIELYHSDYFSRIMPGQKDYVLVRKHFTYYYCSI